MLLLFTPLEPSCLVQTDWMWCSFQCSYHSFAFALLHIPFFSIFVFSFLFSFFFCFSNAMKYATVSLDECNRLFCDINEFKSTFFHPLLLWTCKYTPICPKIIYKWTKSLSTDSKLQHFILFENDYVNTTYIDSLNEYFVCNFPRQHCYSNIAVWTGRKNVVNVDLCMFVAFDRFVFRFFHFTWMACSISIYHLRLQWL